MVAKFNYDTKILKQNLKNVTEFVSNYNNDWFWSNDIKIRSLFHLHQCQFVQEFMESVGHSFQQPLIKVCYILETFLMDKIMSQVLSSLLDS